MEKKRKKKLNLNSEIGDLLGFELYPYLYENKSIRCYIYISKKILKTMKKNFFVLTPFGIKGIKRKNSNFIEINNFKFKFQNNNYFKYPKIFKQSLMKKKKKKNINSSLLNSISNLSSSSTPLSTPLKQSSSSSTISNKNINEKSNLLKSISMNNNVSILQQQQQHSNSPLIKVTVQQNQSSTHRDVEKLKIIESKKKQQQRKQELDEDDVILDDLENEDLEAQLFGFYEEEKDSSPKNIQMKEEEEEKEKEMEVEAEKEVGNEEMKRNDEIKQDIIIENKSTTTTTSSPIKMKQMEEDKLLFKRFDKKFENIDFLNQTNISFQNSIPYFNNEIFYHSNVNSKSNNDLVSTSWKPKNEIKVIEKKKKKEKMIFSKELNLYLNILMKYKNIVEDEDDKEELILFLIKNHDSLESIKEEEVETLIAVGEEFKITFKEIFSIFEYVMNKLNISTKLFL